MGGDLFENNQPGKSRSDEKSSNVPKNNFVSLPIGCFGFCFDSLSSVGDASVSFRFVKKKSN